MSTDDPIEPTMLRALAVLRVVVLINSIGLYLYRQHGYQRPGLGLAVMGVLVIWTAVAIWAYDAPARRTPFLLGLDLLVAIGAIALTHLVKGPHVNATLPGYWVMGPVLAWAIHWRWRGGLVASLAVAVADLSIRNHITQSTYGTTFLLVIGGPIVGFLSGLLREMAAERDRAERLAAAAAERQRIARVVHDGVLQVLALVQKRGLELGGEAAELGRLAGEQEIALRGFVQHDALVPAELSGELDLADELGRLQTPSVSVAVPGTAFRLPAATTMEVVAVVAACLSNVRHHVGRDAPAWVLLEDLGTSWAVSVRDEGPGIPAGRLSAAAAEGRLGVSESIVRRVESLGGEASLHTGPGVGTEWEFSFPRVAQVVS